MDIELQKPLTPPSEWEDAASIAVVIEQHIYNLYVAARAAKTFPDSPGGIDALIASTEQIASAWRDYANALMPLDEDETN